MRNPCSRADRGSAIVMVVVFASILTSIGMSVMYMNSTEDVAARVDVDRSRALYLAEAGLERAKSSLQNAVQWPDYDYGDPYEPFGTVIVDTHPASAQGTYWVRIDPANDNRTRLVKEYEITSIGKAGNFEKRITATVTLRNVCSYAYFTDREIEKEYTVPVYHPTSAAHDVTERIYFSQNDKFSGQVHSNDQMSFVSKPDIAAIPAVAGPPAQPAIPAVFESTAPARQYVTSSSTPTIFSSSAQRIDLFGKWNNRIQRIVDFAGSDSRVSYYPYTGPVDLEVENNCVHVTQGASTHARTKGAKKGLVIMVNGNVTISSRLDGSTPPKAIHFRDILTVISTGTITITNNIQIENNAVPPEKVGIIGLVAPVIAVSPAVTGTLEIDAALMAECFKVPAWNTQNGNKLIINGAVLTKYRYPIGEVTDHSIPQDGFIHEYNFDQRLANTLPYYFPTYFMLKQISRHEDAIINN